MLMYNIGMHGNSANPSDRENAYKADKGFRSTKAGAVIGMLVGALAYLLFSHWIPEHFFGPIVIATAVIFAIVFGLFFPVELEYHELDDDPDAITPADRVSRLRAEMVDQDRSEQ